MTHHFRAFIGILILSIGSATASGSPRIPSVHGQAAIVVDADTGVVLYAKNADERRPVASTQKLMTALLVLEHPDINGVLTVDRSDTLVAPANIGLRTGERYHRLDLLRAMLVKSSNDLAHCLARDFAGSEAAFAARMTQRARRLGMVNTVFRNASGLPADGQYSTARDMARLAITAYHNPTIRSITQIEKLPFRFNSGRTITLTNTNKLLGKLAGCNGMKTGYTNAAGRTLVTSISRDGHNVICIILGSTTARIFSDSQSLLEYGIARAKQM